MPAPRPWTSDEDDVLRERLAAGVSQRAVGRELDRTPGSVASRAHKLGIRSDRAQTYAATAAVVIDSKSRRAKLEHELLEDAERLRGQLWSPTVVFNFGGKDNTYEERTLDEPPHADKLKIMQAVGIAVDRSLKISAHDADTGVAEAVGALDAVEQAIAAAAAAIGPMEDA
jgi:hypothetical protein